MGVSFYHTGSSEPDPFDNMHYMGIQCFEAFCHGMISNRMLLMLDYGIFYEFAGRRLGTHPDPYHPAG
jgi:hypothetical protein